VLRARCRALRCFDILRGANDVNFRPSAFRAFVEQRKLGAGRRAKGRKKRLTSGMKIDNLEKFAKTSLVAEVILERPSQDLESQRQGRKEVERRI